jgi:hypothetical protein
MTGHCSITAVIEEWPIRKLIGSVNTTPLIAGNTGRRVRNERGRESSDPAWSGAYDLTVCQAMPKNDCRLMLFAPNRTGELAK